MRRAGGKGARARARASARSRRYADAGAGAGDGARALRGPRFRANPSQSSSGKTALFRSRIATWQAWIREEPQGKHHKESTVDRPIRTNGDPPCPRRPSSHDWILWGAVVASGGERLRALHRWITTSCAKLCELGWKVDFSRFA